MAENLAPVERSDEDPRCDICGTALALTLDQRTTWQQYACPESGKGNKLGHTIIPVGYKQSPTAAPPAARQDEAARKIAIEILEWLNFDTSLDAVNADIYGVQAIISRHCFSAPAESVDHTALKSELDVIRGRLNQFHAEYERPIVDLKRLLEICDLLVAGLEAAGTPPPSPLTQNLAVGRF